jgi:hypothetical protein
LPPLQKNDQYKWDYQGGLLDVVDGHLFSKHNAEQKSVDNQYQLIDR